MRASRHRIRKAMIIVCAIVAPLPVADAGPTLIDELAWLPGDVDFVLGVRDMARVRATPLGMGATALVQTGIILGDAGESQTMKAWQSLSENLGFTEERAFDALLGDRFFYASRERDDGDTDWVIFSRTSAKIARHVRRKLDVAPREIKHERVLMSLEGGAYRLSSLIEKESAWLMLAPTNRSGLFDQISNNHDEPEWQTLGMTQPLDKIRDLGKGELTLFMTLGEGDEAGWLGLVAKEGRDLVTFEVLSDPGTPLPAIEPWPTAIFDELRDDALYAQIERLPTGMGARAVQPDDQRQDSIIEGLRKLFDLPRQMLGQDLELILGQRLAIVALPKDGGGLSVGVGFEATDIRALAPHGDAAMRSIVDSISTIYGAHEADFEFIGKLPRAKRRITLEPGLHRKRLPPFGNEISVTWSFRDTPGQAPVGWWVAGTDGRAFERCSDALTGLNEAVDDGQVAAWLTLIEAYPAALVRSMREGGVTAPQAFRGFESVESFWLRTWIPENQKDQQMRGRGSIHITEPRDVRKGPKQHQR